MLMLQWPFRHSSKAAVLHSKHLFASFKVKTTVRVRAVVGFKVKVRAMVRVSAMLRFKVRVRVSAMVRISFELMTLAIKSKTDE